MSVKSSRKLIDIACNEKNKIKTGDNANIATLTANKHWLYSFTFLQIRDIHTYICEYIKLKGKSMSRHGQTDGNNLHEGVANWSQAKARDFEKVTAAPRGASNTRTTVWNSVLEQASETAPICVRCNFKNAAVKALCHQPTPFRNNSSLQHGGC